MTKRVTMSQLLLLAALGVGVRFILTDQLFFRLERLPNHDMSQGLAFFTTSMHSVYLSGDLAWWYPGSLIGYAQYFQGLFSPLAPTYGHISFIAWSHVVALLGALGIHLPEYYQYLFVTYVLLPFAAFVAFGYFCAQFLERREAVALAMTAYVLSGVGLWNSAWFYFQEPASVFFFLGATLALLRRPTPARACVWAASVLIQFASLNYWTVYNIFFVAIVLGTHAAAYPQRWRRLAVRSVASARANRRAVGIVALGCLAVILLWTAVIASAFLEQSGRQVRAVYSLADALARVHELRFFTIELFDPWLERSRASFALINAMHNARYLGMAILPLSLFALAGPWSRRIRWLLSSALLVLAVCLASPYALAAWIAIPYMDRIQHALYFYTAYWQLLVILLAAAGLDRLLAGKGAVALRAIVVCGLGLSVLVFAGSFALSDRYPLGDPALQSNLLAALLLAIACVLLGRWAFMLPSRDRGFARLALLAFLFLDLSAYFYTASRADMEFTAHRNFANAVPSAEAKAKLRAPWPEPDPAQGFGAGLAQAMPVSNDFWPSNTYMIPAQLSMESALSLAHSMPTSRPFLFYDTAAQSSRASAESYAGVPKWDHVLHVAGVSDGASLDDAGFAFRWRRWRYNDFDVDITAPRAGWLLVHQQFDPAWRYRIDGQQVQAKEANYVSTALPIAAGTHRVEAEYRPLSRALYRWAAAALEIAVTALFCLAWLTLPASSHKPIRP